MLTGELAASEGSVMMISVRMSSFLHLGFVKSRSYS
jgi:hypothetical protein